MTFKAFQVKNSTLKNFEVDIYAEKLKLKHYVIHLMLDEIKGKDKASECDIINLDLSSEAGAHYTCYFKQGMSKIYFDSIGIKPPNEMVNYLEFPILYSIFRIQQPNNSICSKQCLYLLYHLSNSYYFKDINLT